MHYHDWLASIDINRFVTGTLDSICEELLTTHRDPNDPAPVLVEGFVGNGILTQQALFPQQAHSNQNLAAYLAAFTLDGGQPANFGDTIKICRTLVDRFVHDLVDLNSYRAATTHTQARVLLATAVADYRQYMADGSRMDFSLLEETFLNRLTQGRLQRYTTGVRAVLVDEYQDTNPLQECIYFTLIDSTRASFTVVGDDDQSLYRFRGATVELFSDFRNRFHQQLPALPAPHREDLISNYRSTPEIVDFFNTFITGDPDFQGARVNPPKPRIAAQQPTNGVGVLGLFRQDAATLADDLTVFLMDVFRNGGRVLPGGQRIVADPNGGDFGDAVLLSHTVNEFGSQWGARPPRERLPKLLRDRLAQSGVAVFNPRGRHLRDIPQVKHLLGVLLHCIDPQSRIQGTMRLRAEATRYLNTWRQEGQTFMTSNPAPRRPHTLAGFVQAWQQRRSQTTAPWPQEWPLLELCFKIVSWIPFLQDDPEGQVYLEAIARCIAQGATFSAYRSNILRGQGVHDDNSVKKAIQDVLSPLAESAVEVDEEIMPHVPRTRFPIMTIHQAKGLEFPLVIVDVASDYATNNARTRFRRFPESPSSVQNMEDDLAGHCAIGPLRQTRTGLQRSFDDLIRLYYVAYSRPEAVLMLVGQDRCLQYGTSIMHVATCWASNRTWPWITPVTGRRPGQANNIPLTLV